MTIVVIGALRVNKSTYTYKGGNSNCFISLLKRGLYSKKKEFALKGSKSFCSRVQSPFQKGLLCIKKETQSTLIISKSKGFTIILQHICTSTQICRIEEKINQTTTFHK